MATIINKNQDKRPDVKLSVLDKVVSWINPRAGLNRVCAKAALSYLGNTGYISSKSNKRSMLDWYPGANRSADEDTIPHLVDIRASCRDLAMNMPIATGALERVKTNAVGTGLILQSTIDTDFLNMSEEAAAEWQRNTEREFDVWANSTECDATNEQNFYELQQLAIYNTMLSGDLFVAMVSIERNGFPYAFKVKMIEADQCSNPNDRLDGLTGKNGHTIIGGIERDENGAPVEYNFKKNVYNSFDLSWTQVPAFGESGLRNVLHLFDRLRVGQSRGLPMLAPVVEPLKNLVRYSDAELMGTIVASFFSVFIKSKSPMAGGLAPTFGAPNSVVPGSPPVTSPVEDDEKRKIELAPAMITELGVDEDISIADPRRPNDQFEPFFAAFVKQIGSALNIPFEELILNFTSSYSASRAALLQAWKFYRMRREWLCWKFCNPVYIRWLSEAIALGRIDAPGFFEDISIAMAWAKNLWGGPGMGQIDPKKETSAAVDRINNYLSNREIEATAIHGGSTGKWEGIFRRNVNERRMILDSGVETPPNTEETEPDKPTIEELEDEQ